MQDHLFVFGAREGVSLNDQDFSNLNSVHCTVGGELYACHSYTNSVQIAAVKLPPTQLIWAMVF